MNGSCCVGYTWTGLLAALLLIACKEHQTPEAPKERQEDRPSTADAALVADAQLEPNQARPDAAATTHSADAGVMMDAAISSGVRDAAERGSADAAAATPDVPPSTAPQCLPSGGGPYTLLEGETLQIELRCSIGPARTFVLASGPEGAQLSAGGATVTWTPRLDQGGRHELVVRDPLSGETGSVRVDVVDRFDAPDNQSVDPASYQEEYGLPVLHVTTEPGLNYDEYTPAIIVYRGHTYAGAEAKLRGATSRTYPKNSLTLKFTKEDKFNEPSFAGGFLNKRKVTVTTTFDDNAYVRQRFCYELWNRLDPSHIKVQAYNAVLFRNGKYHGLYTVSDHIDGYLMEDFGLNQDGDLYKARTSDANFSATRSQSGEPKQTLHDGFTKEEGYPASPEPGAFDNLDGFMRWVIDSTPEQLAAEADSRIHVLDYVDWWIFVSFLAADDSVGKNSYHYRDPMLADSVWRYIPWDLNHSLGQQWNTRRVPASVTRPEGLYPTMNLLFEKLLESPRLPEMRRRYGEVLASTAFALDDITALFDAMVAEVDASARRDEQMWGERYRSFMSWSSRTDFLSYEQEVQYVRQWLRDRHAYLAARYPAQPAP